MLLAYAALITITYLGFRAFGKGSLAKGSALLLAIVVGVSIMRVCWTGFLIRAASSGNTRVIEESVKRDAFLGLMLLEQAGDGGHAPSLLMLGKIYKDGIVEDGRMVVEPNAMKAATYFQKAREAGETSASSWLEGLPEDARRAAQEDAERRHQLRNN